MMLAGGNAIGDCQVKKHETGLEETKHVETSFSTPFHASFLRGYF